MNITIIGTGYVGLVSGTCFAEMGNNVVCVDIDTKKVHRMQNGHLPIYEPGLEVLFERNTKQGRLSFTTDLAKGVDHGEIIFLALPTPPDEDGSADLSYILLAAEQIAQLLKTYKVIVDKSTVPVGTAVLVRNTISKYCDEDIFDVVSNPEFLREGVAIDDFMKPDRVVIGTDSDKAFALIEQLYAPFTNKGNPVYKMDLNSAEMTKYAANSYLATRITFMNEIANLCEKVGANVDHVRRGVGSDSRIGKRFLYPGVGYGGSCFPKDIEALVKTAEKKGYDFQILNAVTNVNNLQKYRVFEMLRKHFNNKLKGKNIAVWGLAFKPNTDDIREAPALYTIDALLEAGVNVSVFDPKAMDNTKDIYNDRLNYAKEQYEALMNVDALAIMTEWSVFRSPSFEVMSELMKSKVVADGRNLFDLDEMKRKGFTYYSIGRV